MATGLCKGVSEYDSTGYCVLPRRSEHHSVSYQSLQREASERKVAEYAPFIKPNAGKRIDIAARYHYKIFGCSSNLRLRISEHGDVEYGLS